MTINHLSGPCKVWFDATPETVRGMIVGTVAITDDNVYAAWPTLWPERTLVVPPGEISKSFTQYEKLINELAALRVKRDDKISVVGGGVVGDLAGFAAATYMRGIGLQQVPTTLMAQVDSSIGGKVGINLDAGKNLLGSFYAPLSVVICPRLLDTLPTREFRSGVAEMVKYGCIADPELFDTLRQPLNVRSESLPDLIKQCAAIKARIVEADEFEAKGHRAALNFGHTIGHAIEHSTGYGTLLHGEAVAIGMVLEAKLGERIGVTQQGVALEIENVLNNQSLPTSLPAEVDPESLIRAMAIDKKADGSGLKFSLITRLGECKLMGGIAEDAIRSTIKNP